MPKFSANISMMFTEHAFLDRFSAAREAGFGAVEILFPYDHPAELISDLLHQHGLALSVFNLHPGDWARGDRGLAAVCGGEDRFRASVEQALAYAGALGAERLHVMAGIAPSGPESDTRYIRNIRWAADRFAKAGLTALIEPINAHDMPGYFLSSTDQALELLQRIDRPNVRLQFDIYHHQITHSEVIATLERTIGQIAHIQIAGVPGRHEPDQGALDYRPVFAALGRLGYDGWVGCEYHPRGKTEDGLGWLKTLI
ncbi:MAG: TIM barrel protein [Rhodobacteraceae bacterium]|nr:TIM barrel protein [Paracoccaceae bacterium]